MPRQTQAEREEEQTLYLRKKIFGSLLWFQVAEIALYGTNAEFFKRVWEYRERIPAHGRCRYKKLLEELINKCGDSILSVVGFTNRAELWTTFEQIPPGPSKTHTRYFYDSEEELWLLWLEQIKQELWVRKWEFAKIKEKVTNLMRILLEQIRTHTDNR